MRSTPQIALPLLACAVALWAPPASAADREDARVIVHVDKLGPPGAAPGPREARVHVTGVGFPPQRAAGTAQGRLMARRAAVVDGYRNITRAAYRWRKATGAPYSYKGSGPVFVRGAAVEGERYFGNGRVEVDMSAPAPYGVSPPDTPERWRRLQETAARAGMHVVTVPARDPGRREISREDWEQMFATRQTDPAATP